MTNPTLQNFARGILLGSLVILFHAGIASAAPHPLNISLTPLGTHTNGPPYNTSAAEIVAHDPHTQRLYVVNAQGKRIDVLRIKDPTNPTRIASIDLSAIGPVVNSVDVHNGLVAVAVEGPVKTEPGHVVFFDRRLKHLGTIQVGALPDMVLFTRNGRFLLVANEGEPNTYNNFGSETNGPSIDPEGSVCIIDLKHGVDRASVRTASFTPFNSIPLDPSIRVFGPNATVAQDLEPEYIAVSDDSRTAWVTLQENNAIATIDIQSATVIRIDPLGLKDHTLPGHGLDASDQDGGINIVNWPLRGVYMPDGIASYRAGGQTFLVMANEGDTRVYPGFSEEVRVGTLTLDPTLFPNAADLKSSNQLGRLTVTRANSDPDNDGDVDALYALGGRSFSIRTTTGQLVWDSGDDFEQLTALMFPDNFNCSNTANSRDARSASKGPEPEGLALGKVFGRTLAFVGFERIGGVVVYDISDPLSPHLSEYINLRNFENPFDFATAGDLGPEGLIFISAEDSPNHKPLLVVAHEVSGSTTIFQIDRRKHQDEDDNDEDDSGEDH